MAAQTGKQQPQAVQEFRSRTKGTAHPGNARALMESQRRRYMTDFLHIGFTSLRDAAARIGRQRLQITA